MAGITDKQCDKWATQVGAMSVQDMRRRVAGFQTQADPVRSNLAAPDLSDVGQAQDFRDAYVAVCSIVDSLAVATRDPRVVTDRAPYEVKVALLNYLAAKEPTLDVAGEWVKDQHYSLSSFVDADEATRPLHLQALYGSIFYLVLAEMMRRNKGRVQQAAAARQALPAGNLTEQQRRVLAVAPALPLSMADQPHPAAGEAHLADAQQNVRRAVYQPKFGIKLVEEIAENDTPFPVAWEQLTESDTLCKRFTKHWEAIQPHKLGISTESVEAFDRTVKQVASAMQKVNIPLKSMFATRMVWELLPEDAKKLVKDHAWWEDLYEEAEAAGKTWFAREVPVIAQMFLMIQCVYELYFSHVSGRDHLALLFWGVPQQRSEPHAGYIFFL